MATAIIEKDPGTTMCVWSYPSIDNATEAVLIDRSALQPMGFFYSKFKVKTSAGGMR